MSFQFNRFLNSWSSDTHTPNLCRLYFYFRLCAHLHENAINQISQLILINQTCIDSLQAICSSVRRGPFGFHNCVNLMAACLAGKSWQIYCHQATRVSMCVYVGCVLAKEKSTTQIIAFAYKSKSFQQKKKLQSNNFLQSKENHQILMSTDKQRDREGRVLGLVYFFLSPLLLSRIFQSKSTVEVISR